MIKQLYIYWDTGFLNAPEIVKKCLLSWKIKNPTWKIIELDDTNLKDYVNIYEVVPDFNKNMISKTGFSDILRIFLLKKYGGLWCDATTFCIDPIDEWLYNHIESGFFAYSFNEPCDRLLSSWFLYADYDNYIINNWYKKVIELIINNINVDPEDNSFTKKYFWFHYLFGDLYKSDDMFKKIWDETNKLSEKLPHFLQNVGLLKRLNTLSQSHIDNKMSHLYKLTYKYNESMFINNKKKDSVLHYVFNYYGIKFIHIGKCAGTTIVKTFKLPEIHLEKPAFKKNNYYVIWVRNPINRFVSAFYYSYELVKLDIKNLNPNNLNLDNCLAPVKIQHKIKNNGITFDKEYDDIVSFFKTANNLAESLSSPIDSIKEKALKLMNSGIEHIGNGIGWYLDNGDFIKKYHKNILFVGKVETMSDDVNKLSGLLNVTLPSEIKKVRENIHLNDVSLSKKAIENIVNFYNDSDYKALIEMKKWGFIDDETLESYYNYKYIIQ
jgi:hypothetical protein